MAGVFSSNSTYIEIADNAALDMPNTGWTFQFFVYPDSSVGGSTNQYIYSHAQPLVSQLAFNIFRVSGGTSIRTIIDWAGGNLFDGTTSTALLTLDTWNTVIFSYNGTNLFIAVGANGTANVETGSPPALPSITPAGVARIGQSSWTTAGTRWWVGRIAQAAKLDLALPTAAEAQRQAAQYLTPGFFPATSAWQIAMWNAPSFDVRGALSVTDVSMSYGADGPWQMPQETARFDEFMTPVVTQKVFQYFRYG
jgi:hypothetical protein